MALAYRRALLKISGEALAGEKGVGLDYAVVETAGGPDQVGPRHGRRSSAW